MIRNINPQSIKVELYFNLFLLERIAYTFFIKAFLACPYSPFYKCFNVSGTYYGFAAYYILDKLFGALPYGLSAYSLKLYLTGLLLVF
jgi:hypothetical protein